MSKILTKLKSQILQILENYPKSRDSDLWLTIKLWCVFYPSRIKNDEKLGKFVFLKDIMELPREDAVKRIRAVIQNEEHKYLPTNWKVAKQRKINEDIWKDYTRNYKTHPDTL